MTPTVPPHSPDIELGTYTGPSVAASLSPELITQEIDENENETPTPRDAGPISRTPTYTTYDPGLDPSLIPSLSSVLQLGQFHPPPPPPPSPLPCIPLASDEPAGHARSTVAEGNYGDPSDKLFSVYLTQAEKFDKEESESWKGDTEGILVFTGLFSATVAAFIIESYKQLQPNSGDTTVLLLAQISQQLAALSNGTSISIPSTLPNQTFRPSTSAVRVNILWFLSLTLSLTCALLATLMQQWVRRYLQVSQRWYAPYKRARIRTFFAEGVERFGLPRAVEALPALLHASVFLFFAGLIDFLLNINHKVAISLLSAVAMGASAYFLCTALPLIYSNSPYQTPLTTLLWVLQQVLLVSGLDLMRRVVRFIYEHTGLVGWKLYGRLVVLLDEHSRRLAQGFLRSREAIALKQPPEMDARALGWTLDALDEDHELERLVAAIPGYYRSTTVRPPAVALKHLTHHEGLDSPLEARILELHSPRGTAPNQPPTSELEQNRRVACLEALYCLPGVITRHVRAATIDPSLFVSDPLFASPEAWVVATSMTNDSNRDIALAAHCVASVLVVAWCYGYAASPGPPGGSVGALARHLGVSEDVANAWLRGGDNVMLANFIRLIEDTLDDLLESDAASLVPVGVSVPNTPPRYQMIFVTLGLVNKFSAVKVVAGLA
ncbi:hypothetical protein EI94DRAFT_217344 [Lactarius quietus]|nr:hypothetical protein EI94DRAFT_217344 [Lactarius quietus]